MSKEKTLVSVVTITYNHEKYIEQALDGILAQKGSEYRLEIIVADDASTDTTQAIIKRYSEKYPDIVKPIFREKNTGIQNNLIDALKNAKGKYVALCEGDDYWTNPEKLAQQVSLLESNKNLNICFHPTRVFFDDNSYPDTKYPIGRTKFTPLRLMSENFIPTNSVMYRRVSYDNLRNDLMPFDWYLHGYHLQEGEIGFIDKKMSAYRRHKGGAWWTSHGDTRAFWDKFGPEMMNVLNEFRKLYSGNETMTSGVSKGEFRILNEMFQHGTKANHTFKDHQLAIDYAFNASEFIQDYYLNKRGIEVRLQKRVEELLADNQQKSEEAVMLRRDLGNYIKELSKTQFSYDSLRSDLKNPSRIVERVTKRIFGK